MAEVNISVNTGIDMFKNNIIETIGNSQLPIGSVYYVLKDILNETEKIYNDVLKKEQEEILAQMKKEQEEAEKEDMENHQE